MTASPPRGGGDVKLDIEVRQGALVIWIENGDGGDQPILLRRSTEGELSKCLDQIEKMLSHGEAPRILVIASRHPTCFIAGADVDMVQDSQQSGDTAALSRGMHRALDRLEAIHSPVAAPSRLSRVVIAAIGGACLGGGLELALACSHRVAAASVSLPSTQLGLPEVKLGLIPGGGGTQRLPRLIGLAKALQLILTGKNLTSEAARKLGLIDRVVNVDAKASGDHLVQEAVRFGQELLERGALRSQGYGFAGAAAAAILAAAVRASSTVAPRLIYWLALAVLAASLPSLLIVYGHAFGPHWLLTPPSRRIRAGPALQHALIDRNIVGRKLLLWQARRSVLKETKGNYPAPLAALHSIEAGLVNGVERGSQVEAREFARLAASPEAAGLIGVFKAMRQAKTNSLTSQHPDIDIPKLTRIGIEVGSDQRAQRKLVGPLAVLAARKAKLDVILIGAGEECTSVAQIAQELLEKNRRLSAQEKRETLQRITTSQSGNAPLNATFRLPHQQRDGKASVPTGHDFVLCSFEEDVRALAVSDTILFQFGADVQLSPFLEVVFQPSDRLEAALLAESFGAALGKTTVCTAPPIGVGPARSVTARLFEEYILAAKYLRDAGKSEEDVDRLARKAGFSVGPFKLSRQIAWTGSSQRAASAPALLESLDRAAQGARDDDVLRHYREAQDWMLDLAAVLNGVYPPFKGGPATSLRTKSQ